MKIGVMSDSHDNLPMIRKALALFEREGAECLIHAGDIVAPFSVREIMKFKGRALGCFGNNDGERVGIKAIWPEICEPPRELKLGGRTILLTHDEALLKKKPDMLKRAEIVIFGHSHQPVLEPRGEKSPLRLNPGECGGWLSGKGTVALLDTEQLEARIVEL